MKKTTINYLIILIVCSILIFIAEYFCRYKAQNEVPLSIPPTLVEQPNETVWTSLRAISVSVSFENSDRPKKREWRIPFLPLGNYDSRRMVCAVIARGQTQKWGFDYVYKNGRVIGAEFRKNQSVELLGSNERLENIYVRTHEKIAQVPDIDVADRIPNIIESLFSEVHPDDVEQITIWSVILQGIDDDDVKGAEPRHIIIANVFAKDALPESPNLPSAAMARYSFKSNGELESIDNMIIPSPEWHAPK